MSRVSRRRFVSRLVLAAGATPILLSVGCGQTAPPSPTTAPAAPTTAPQPTKPAAATSAPAATTAATPQAAATTGAATAVPATATPQPAWTSKVTPVPAVKGQSLAFLGFTYFVPEAQGLYKQQITDWGKVNGVNATADFLNWPDVQAKIAASIAAASGQDLFEFNPGWQWLYKDNIVDLTDLATKVGQNGGGYEDYVTNSILVDGRYLGVPHGSTNASMAYRMSWFKDAGVDVPDPATQTKNGSWLDMTWDQYFAVAKKTKAAGHPFGQALGHSTGDPPGFTYPYMWANGAMEVEKDGKTVAFNKPEFVDAMKKFIQAWKDGYDETGLSWDDNANNRLYLSGQIASTYNGSSIYIAARKDQPAIATDTMHMLIPKGPAGRFYNLGSRSFAILKSSKNVDAAKAFLDWWFQDAQYGPWFQMQKGYFLQNTKKWANDPIWSEDPKMAPFKEQPKYGRDLGWAGPPNKNAALSWSKYIVVDTFAKAIQGGDAQAAITWGADELKKVYGG